MAEERIPLDVKGQKAEDLPSHLQKQLDLRTGPYATPMTPFSPFEGASGGNDSPFARVDSMGMGGEGLPSVSFTKVSHSNRHVLYLSKIQPCSYMLS